MIQKREENMLQNSSNHWMDYRSFENKHDKSGISQKSKFTNQSSITCLRGQEST